jgi:hypothetical protein
MKRTGLQTWTVFNFIMMKQASFQALRLSAFFIIKSTFSIIISLTTTNKYAVTEQYYFSSG